MQYGRKKEVKLSNVENGVLRTLFDHPSGTLRIRKTSLSNDGKYCLYDKNMSPLCTWPRPVINGLIAKDKIDYTKETGIFILL